MPADDLVLNVRQIAGYGDAGSALASDALLIQRGGLGGPYLSLDAAALVSTALSQGGDFTVGGQVAAQSFSGGSAAFSNASVGMFSAQNACIVDLAAVRGSIGGVAIATIADVAATVTSFNGRVGAVGLWIDDIICAGGAPIFSPRFQGEPRANTPPPTSNSSRIATTCFVATALAAAQADLSLYALLDSPDFSGVPTAPTAPLNSADGQIATTAFVMNAVSESTTGVASFNARTGVVVLTTADLTAAGGAVLASPAFTGTPTAPTAGPGTSSTQLATTAFVANAVSGLISGVASFNGRSGAVTLVTSDITGAGGALVSGTVASFNGRGGAVNFLANDLSAVGGALLASPAFTGTPTAPTPTAGDNSTRIATTAFLANYTGFAPIASPTFTGTPAAPTAAPGVATTQLATTAFVMAAIAGSVSGVASFNGRNGAVTLIGNDLTAAGGALLASPAFTGSPTAPTATAGTSTTQLATCAFVAAAIAAAGAGYLPLTGGTITGSVHVNGTVTAGGIDGSAGVVSALTLSAATANGSVVIGHNGTVGNINDVAGFCAGGAVGGVFEQNTNPPLNLNVFGVADGIILQFFQTSSLTPGNIGVSNGTSTNYNTSSDVRLKADERSFDAGPILDLIEVYDFAWTRGGHRSHGVMAQEVNEVYPAAVTHDARTDWWGVDYSKFVSLLLNEVKALRLRVAALEAT